MGGCDCVKTKEMDTEKGGCDGLGTEEGYDETRTACELLGWLLISEACELIGKQGACELQGKSGACELLGLILSMCSSSLL